MTAEVIQLHSTVVDAALPATEPAPHMPRDLVLWLTLDASAAEAITASPLLAKHTLKRPYTRRVEQVFWDTVDHRLGKSGLALGIQGNGQKRIQFIQLIRDIRAGGRSELDIQTAIAGDRPDLVKLALMPGSDAVLASSLDPATLIPVFAIDVKRTSWTLDWHGTSLVVALEIGSISAGPGIRELRHLRLAHIAGPVNGLYDFARGLARAVPLALTRLLPSQQGYDLVAGENWWPTQQRPSLQPHMTVRHGFIGIARASISAVRQTLEEVAGSLEPERIHQARVALRRLRSVLSVFAPVLPETARRSFAKELSIIAETLGRAREWDVFRTETLLPLASQLRDEKSLTSLELTANVLREQAAFAARAAICDDKKGKPQIGGTIIDLSLRLAAWFDAGIWPEAPSGDAIIWLDRPIIDFAREILRKRHRKLLRAAANLVDPQPDELHALRIEAKKLRYTAEFFAKLFPPRASRRYLRSLAAIQDILGTVNDAAMARLMVMKIAGANDVDAARAAGLVTGWTAAQSAAARQSFAQTWDEFQGVKKFWKES